MHRLSSTSLAALVCSVLLTGCVTITVPSDQAAEPSGSASAPISAAATVSSTPSPITESTPSPESVVTQPEQAPTTPAPAEPAPVTEEAPAPDPAPVDPAGYVVANEVDNPCLTDPDCRESGYIDVNHATLGPVRLVSYYKYMTPNVVPGAGYGYYAVFQNGRTIGFVQSPEYVLAHFSMSGIFAPNIEPKPQGWNIDRYGHIYMNGFGTLTIITQKDWGFDSQGTMPGASEGWHNNVTDMTIDSQGNPYIYTHQLDETIDRYVDGPTYTFNGTDWVTVD
ncbi:hypothetical protein [Rothia nasimurium]|uniref:hypothetical protein n=1 Tax=Rothia nasimurium TaxID=85336 RepID=UPI001F21D62C|nr:hypothetical protein [Rothia nasimurium]